MNIVLIVVITMIFWTQISIGAESDYPTNHPLAKIEEDTHSAMPFNPHEPFQLKFGRGSGFVGLNTVDIDATGNATLCRIREESKDGRNRPYWEVANIQISKASLAVIARALQDCKLLQMKKAYHAEANDGTQWLFWVRQEGKTKSIYFDNHFPDDILRFAKILDQQLDLNGLQTAVWVRTDVKQARSHEKDLWDSIK